MEPHKISVVLPVYNGEKYVEKSINSVLNQTYRNIELIIVNDCSTDSTLEIITKYAEEDNRIRIINNPENKTLHRTLNIGFSYAKGDYLTWTSDDNLYHVDAIKKMVDILDNNTEIELVYSDFSICDMEGNVILEIKEEEPDEIRFKDNIGACFLYRKALAEKVGEYDTETFLAEDYDFFIRCYKESGGRFYHIREDLYDYGRHDANLSATRQKEIAHKAFDVMVKHFDFLYSQCVFKEDRFRFFDELLALLNEPSENKYQRGIFYNIDVEYKKYDKIRHIRKRIKRVISLPKRIWRKLTKNMRNKGCK